MSISPKTHHKPHFKALTLAFSLLTAAAILVAGCTSGSMLNNATSSATGPAFVVGTDAPMASVTSFAVQIQSIQLTDGSGNTASLISGTPTVDFARYNGLQSLLDMNDVPVGTYTGVTISLGTATIGYLDTTTPPPAITTQTATLTTNTINIPLNKPLVITKAGAPVGLRMDFDLHKSIQLDSNGNITGTVDPTFDVSTVARTDTGGYIDELVAAVVSVNANGQSFVVQGPHGEQFTISVNGQTEWDGNASLSTLNTSSIVQVSGQLDPADQTLDADEVAVLSDKGFYAAGQVTYVTPSTGPATSFDLYVRGLLPTTTGIQLGQIAQVNLTGSENFTIYWMHNPFTQFLFNSSGMVAGQSVAIGGPASGAANANAVTVNRVALRNWGFNGTVVNGSQSSANGTFQMQINGFAGVLIPQTVTVYLGPKSDFRYGLGAFGDLANGSNIRVVGLLLKNPTSGKLVLLGRHVDGLNLSDFTTVNYQ
ncbi:MAG TPA: DUF4382 domain-containing protein [Terracidiphilus sp.]|nr:DUF4382 domain-containing protein [Terracidiphilus sp.]